MTVKTIVTGAVLALALTGASLGATGSAQASPAVDFSISLGNAAFAYSDGYWDRAHRWHTYRNRAEARYFQDHFRDHYSAARHNRDRKDRNQGWRNDRWWDHH